MRGRGVDVSKTLFYERRTATEEMNGDLRKKIDITNGDLRKIMYKSSLMWYTT